ncbi:hypothetical protein ACFO9E_28770 [Streptomyces maoxianensis]|uniref:DUF7848 domain-containing protein n=1 Tax=Streptomyces maoxianensis TaxID=1459942 RepID=A0ABV9GF07_9ACTN
MSPRTIIRSVTWTVRQDSEAGAPAAPIYQAECTTCGEQSAAKEGDRISPEVWTLQHTGGHPSHRSYRAVVTTFWRVTPSADSEVE